jgi:outer membrane scaffolding protein for murein synthesis (MipA/OmpV family)
MDRIDRIRKMFALAESFAAYELDDLEARGHREHCVRDRHDAMVESFAQALASLIEREPTTVTIYYPWMRWIPDDTLVNVGTLGHTLTLSAGT